MQVKDLEVQTLLWTIQAPTRESSEGGDLSWLWSEGHVTTEEGSERPGVKRTRPGLAGFEAEEGATSQGVWAASGRWKRHGNILPWSSGVERALLIVVLAQ